MGKFFVFISSVHKGLRKAIQQVPGKANGHISPSNLAVQGDSDEILPQV